MRLFEPRKEFVYGIILIGMAASRKKTEYQSRRRDDATFDWDAFLRKAAGRVLEVGDLPPEVREAVANGGSTAVAECGYTVETSAIWPEYLSGDQLVFWPEDKPCNPDEAARVFPLAPKCAYEADDGKLFTVDSVLWLKTRPRRAFFTRRAAFKQAMIGFRNQTIQI